MMRALVLAGVFMLVLVPFGEVQAQDGVARLEAFTEQLESLRATFTQSLYDDKGKVVQESHGAVILQRPGRFRWDYTTPYEQQIVADGRKLWIYDTELKQVTVKDLDNALGNAPIMLLSERRPLHDDFRISEMPPARGLRWVALEPRVKDTDFARIALGIDDAGMQVMQLQDSFGQTTEIRFANQQYNVPTDEDAFVFVPPPGVDIVGDP